MCKSVVINCQAFVLSVYPSKEALLTGDGLIREQDQRGSVMIMHFSSFYLEFTSVSLLSP